MEFPKYSQLPDRELLGHFVKGDVAAFEAILARYEKPLLRYAARYDRLGAQDLVQEVFLRLVREKPRLARVKHLSSWLYRVARNLAIDELRKEKRMERREQLAAVPEVQSPAASAVESGEVVELVTSKLMGLPAKQRDVLILKIQEEKSYREISSITGLSVSNVGYLIHQGLRNLARDLQTAGVV